MLFDTHAHLHDPAFDADRALVLARARAAGVTRFLTIGTDVATSETRSRSPPPSPTSTPRSASIRTTPARRRRRRSAGSRRSRGRRRSSPSARSGSTTIAITRPGPSSATALVAQLALARDRREARAPPLPRGAHGSPRHLPRGGRGHGRGHPPLLLGRPRGGPARPRPRALDLDRGAGDLPERPAARGGRARPPARPARRRDGLPLSPAPALAGPAQRAGVPRRPRPRAWPSSWASRSRRSWRPRRRMPPASLVCRASRPAGRRLRHESRPGRALAARAPARPRRRVERHDGADHEPPAGPGGSSRPRWTSRRIGACPRPRRSTRWGCSRGARIGSAAS